MASIEIARATEADLTVASSILTEAARWLMGRGLPLWRPEDLVPERIRPSLEDGSLHLARRDGEAVGTIALQWEDAMFWPDMATGESAFVHRLAVRRAVASQGVAAEMLHWAEARACAAGRRWLRLDCSATHAGLRAYYERAGFALHDVRELAGYRTARFERALGGAGRAGGTP